MSELKIIYVSAAVLMRPDQTLLVAKRPEGKSMAGLWELPGGKIETGETPEQALIRELREELAVHVETSATTPLTFASHAYDNFHLVMPVFLIREWDGEPVAQEGQTLSFVAPGELKTLPAPAADIPLFNFIEDYADRGGFA
ncbi:(deoxy)nucleoside triphosphate pyrophosphohydrolase [Ponticaulis sp.]|uniref:(deoxy)nucleoside triphosphate pyrophosphohydrolase n=1 Tax=Ponticaulis sp. TaxID=2020902 RepID=UPI000B6D6B26|nr:(deoxy)nucleoside triphosphate pyrophosphohydrolase [Ponticaulis sp.]MAI90151.1 8-oxo-dGTP diphosphatase MutT [Ponticaulis sp.]OUX99803.1 MAG: NTP pyrophosphohydrolase [Hyphomonadaceae bacterium TMED5]|tara:strand:- start:108614 stop:109039 length:426 start_codon:yes stop_codon:yes gene_type:complete